MKFFDKENKKAVLAKLAIIIVPLAIAAVVIAAVQGRF